MPPPSAPPLLLSVIPGGFIKQLVRETEKEAKAAKLKKETKVSVKEEVSGAESCAALGCPALVLAVPSPENFLGGRGAAGPHDTGPSQEPEAFFCTCGVGWQGWGSQRAIGHRPAASLEQSMLETSLMQLAIPDLLNWKASNQAKHEALQFSSLSAGRGVCGASLGTETSGDPGHGMGPQEGRDVAK